MAEIYGITLKSVKTFKGREGICFQGSLYYQGKKVGFWSQDGRGGITDDFTFQSFEIEKEVSSKMDKYVKEHLKEESFITKELFMNKLLELTLFEKKYKKYVKKGYNCLLLTTDGFHKVMWNLILDVKEKEKEAAHQLLISKFKKELIEMEQDFFKNVEPKRYAFLDLKDFIIKEEDHEN